MTCCLRALYCMTCSPAALASDAAWRPRIGSRGRRRVVERHDLGTAGHQRSLRPAPGPGSRRFGPGGDRDEFCCRDRSVPVSSGGRNAVSAPEVLMEGVVFGESPRWHDGRLWFSDWGAHQVIAVGPGGGHEVVVTVESFPMCIDFLPDGRLL